MTHRWCNGPCGRFLPFDAFPTNGRRGRYSFCRGCHRVAAREEARKHYRRRAKTKLKTERERYASDPDYRARRLATSQRSYERRKLRAA